MLRSQRTTKRVGPGTLWLKLVKAYPGGSCTFTDVAPAPYVSPTVMEYLVGHKGGTQTLFTLHEWPPRAYYGAAAKTFFVVSVAVRTRYEALPEFARDYPYRCRDGWQSTALPRTAMRRGTSLAGKRRGRSRGLFGSGDGRYGRAITRSGSRSER